MRVYSLEQDFRGRVAIGGVPQLMVIRVTGRIEERVERVLEDRRRLLKVRYSFAPPVINGMPVEAEGVPLETEALVLRSPSGEVERLGSAEGFSGLLEMALRSVGAAFPLLPGEEVPPGARWERAPATPAGGGMLSSGSGEFRGIAEEEGPSGSPLAVVSTKGEVRLAGPVAEAGLERLEVDHSGEMRFAIGPGEVVESRQEGTIRLKGRAKKLRFEARVRFTTVLSRIEEQ